MARLDLQNNPVKHKLYTKWSNMIQRCGNKNDPKYYIYGGRGIKVNKKWAKFDNFYDDMHSTFKMGLTLDRINTNKDYSKNNCRWVTNRVQQNNRRDTDMIEFKGIKDSLTGWSRRLGMYQGTLWGRLYKWNWPIEKALMEGQHNGR